MTNRFAARAFRLAPRVVARARASSLASANSRPLPGGRAPRLWWLVERDAVPAGTGSGDARRRRPTAGLRIRGLHGPERRAPERTASRAHSPADPRARARAGTRARTSRPASCRRGSERRGLYERRQRSPRRVPRLSALPVTGFARPSHRPSRTPSSALAEPTLRFEPSCGNQRLTAKKPAGESRGLTAKTPRAPRFFLVRISRRGADRESGRAHGSSAEHPICSPLALLAFLAVDNPLFRWRSLAPSRLVNWVSAWRWMRIRTRRRRRDLRNRSRATVPPAVCATGGVGSSAARRWRGRGTR
jgi:hypothetical protein